MGSVNYFLNGSADIGIYIKGYWMLIEELPIPVWFYKLIYLFIHNFNTHVSRHSVMVIVLL